MIIKDVTGKQMSPTLVHVREIREEDVVVGTVEGEDFNDAVEYLKRSGVFFRDPKVTYEFSNPNPEKPWEPGEPDPLTGKPTNPQTGLTDKQHEKERSMEEIRKDVQSDIEQQTEKRKRGRPRKENTNEQ